MPPEVENSPDLGAAEPRIGYILHRFPYRTETFIVRELAGLVESGLTIDVFSLLRPKHMVDNQEVDLIRKRTHYAGTRATATAWANIRWLSRTPLRYLRALGRTIWFTYREPGVAVRALALFPRSVWIADRAKTLDLKHIHAHFVWLEALAAAVVKDITGIDYSLHPHAFGIFGRDQVSVRKQLDDARGIVAISRFHQDFIADATVRGADDMPVIHCGIDVERFPIRTTNHRGERSHILSVGRAVEKKGHEYLIEAVGHLRRQQRQIKLTIVTGGGESGHLVRAADGAGIAEHFSLIEDATESDIIDLLGHTDVFALACVVAASGDRDGIPVSLMEAMACGVPVVTTPVAGIPDLVIHDQTGLLVSERDVEGLAAAIACLLDDPVRASRLAYRAREHVSDRFDLKQSVDQMREFLIRMCAG